MKANWFIILGIIFSTACANASFGQVKRGEREEHKVNLQKACYENKDSFTLSVRQFRQYLQHPYAYAGNAMVRKQIQGTTVTAKKATPDQARTITTFSTKDYKVAYEWIEYKTIDSMVARLLVNNKAVEFYSPENGKPETVSTDIEFSPTSNIQLYDWPGRRFVMICGSPRGAQGWYRGILSAVLIDVSTHPMKAFFIETYETPGDYYFRFNRANGEITYLTAIPFFGEKGNVDSLTVRVGRIPR